MSELLTRLADKVSRQGHVGAISSVQPQRSRNWKRTSSYVANNPPEWFIIKFGPLASENHSRVRVIRLRTLAHSTGVWSVALTTLTLRLLPGPEVRRGEGRT